MSAKRRWSASIVVTALLLTVILLVGVVGLPGPTEQNPVARVAAAAPALDTLTGRVYEGNAGVEPPGSTPIEGVTVSLYCSNNHAQQGAFLRSTTTGADGGYALDAREVCEFYNIIETDPAGYISNGATSVDGAVIDANWIEYTYPLAGKTLTGNKFWDRKRVTDTPTTAPPTKTPTPTATRTATATNTQSPIPQRLPTPPPRPRRARAPQPQPASRWSEPIWASPRSWWRPRRSRCHPAARSSTTWTSGTTGRARQPMSWSPTCCLPASPSTRPAVAARYRPPAHRKLWCVVIWAPCPSFRRAPRSG